MGIAIELLYAVQWYLLIAFLGIISLPLTISVCSSLPDRGYAVSKTLGILLFAYLSWVLSYAIGYGRNEVILALLILCAVSAVIYKRTKPKIDMLLLLRYELLFGAIFLLFLIIRAYNPDLRDGEKIYDFMVLNSILKSSVLPPHDSWLSGYSMNTYYYFGPFTIATLTKLTAVPPNIAYNLGMIILPALASSAAFGLGLNLTGDRKGGFAALFLLVFAGNLYPAGVIAAHALGMTASPWGSVPGIMEFWGASRIIPDTANEFPYFSFMFGDLHAHVIAIPFVLLVLTLALDMYLSKRVTNTSLLVFGLAMGSLFVFNAWDFATYALLFMILILIRPWNIANRCGETWRDFRTGLRVRLAVIIPVLLLAFAFFAFFFIDFRSSGIQGIKAVTVRTHLINFLVIYDLFLFLLFSFHLIHLPDMKDKKLKIFLVLGSGAALYFVPGFQTLAVFVPLAVLTCAGIYFFYRSNDVNRLFVSVLAALGLALLAFTELFYFDDLFSGNEERFNTVFKYYNQVWILWSMASAFALYDITERKYRMKKAVIAVLYILLVLNSLYLYTGTFSRTDNFNGNASLDGAAYLRDTDFSAYDAIYWINRNISGTQVILEAPGKSYEYTSLISSFTGNPTVIGWTGHEYMLRNNWDEISARMKDVDALYDTDDIEKAAALLRKYNVSYVYVGKVEQMKYGQKGLNKFENPAYFEKVYGGKSEIYRVLP